MLIAARTRVLSRTRYEDGQCGRGSRGHGRWSKSARRSLLGAEERFVRRTNLACGSVCFTRDTNHLNGLRFLYHPIFQSRGLVTITIVNSELARWPISWCPSTCACACRDVQIFARQADSGAPAKNHCIPPYLYYPCDWSVRAIQPFGNSVNHGAEMMRGPDWRDTGQNC